MKITATDSPTEFQRETILRLWNNEYPAQLAYAQRSQLDSYLAALSQGTHFFAGEDDSDLIGWAFVFTRDNERWFAIIVDSQAQGQGIGTQLLNRIKQSEAKLNGWVTDHNNYARSDGQPYLSPLAFYQKSGFEVLPHRRLDTEKLSAVAITWCRPAS